MGLFDSIKRPDFNEGLTKWRATPGSIRLDVRGRDEYAEYGHIEGALNLPIQELTKITAFLPDKDTVIFVHCLSGARSRTASKALQRWGYTNITDIGGILDYRGTLKTDI